MMYNNALMRFRPMSNGGPNMGPGVPNMGTNVPNMGMLPMPFEGGYNPNGPYKQAPMPFGGNYMPSGPYKGPMSGTPGLGGGMPFGLPNPWSQMNSLTGAQNALLGIGGRGSGMNTMNEPRMGNYRMPGMMGIRQR